jgi:hypothetical protein
MKPMVSIEQQFGVRRDRVLLLTIYCNNDFRFFVSVAELNCPHGRKAAKP